MAKRKAMGRFLAWFGACALFFPFGFNMVQADAGKYELSETVDHSGGFLKAAPTVVSEIVNTRSLLYVSETNDDLAAVNAWYYLDEEMNVTTPEGSVVQALDLAIEEMGGKVIPNVYLSSQTVATAFIEWAAENDEFMDMAVVSSSMEVLKTVRESAGRFRRILDRSSETTLDLSQTAKDANEAGAMVVVLGAGAADKSSVEYLQSRMKTVWVKTNGADEFDLLSEIATGAFGIITDGDPNAVAMAYDKFSQSGVTVSRSALNVAHRGDPYNYNENSMEGFIASAEGGATHVEVDAHLTLDREIVIMHDSTIDRTTNGTGTIGRMNLSDIQQYKIIKNIAGTETGVESDIPTIDDLFAYFKDKDTLLFFEIKTSASMFADVFKSKIEEYGMEDKIVVISFDRNQLTAIRQKIPYLWALDLNYSSGIKLGQTLQEACERDVGIDMSYGYVTPTLQRQMLDRGFMPAYWTYPTAIDVETAIWEGVYGITNNDAVAVGELAKDLVVNKTYTVKKSALGAENTVYTANLRKFNGETEEVVCELFAYRDNGKYGEIILTYDVGRWSVISDVIRVEYEGGCASFIGSEICGSLLLTGVALALKQRKK